MPIAHLARPCPLSRLGLARIRLSAIIPSTVPTGHVPGNNASTNAAIARPLILSGRSASVLVSLVDTVDHTPAHLRRRFPCALRSLLVLTKDNHSMAHFFITEGASQPGPGPRLLAQVEFTMAQLSWKAGPAPSPRVRMHAGAPLVGPSANVKFAPFVAESTARPPQPPPRPTA